MRRAGTKAWNRYSARRHGQEARNGVRIWGCAVAIAVLGAAVPSGAERLRVFSSGSRTAIFRSQMKVLDSRLSQEYSDSDRLRPGGGDAAGAGGIPAYRGRYRGAYLALARASAEAHGVPVDLFLRLVQEESGWSMAAVSAKGAIGLAQLMPETAARLGIDIHDPKQNLEGGARYLRMMYDRYGSWRLAVAAYNAGPDAVDSAHGVPAYAETRAYVTAILGG
ncbi:lytic transglycosylase domain-containing protein [Solirhodobacter olei]|uniref:lytic transglycosylase domain-containing protein n=1 Tax=Solirhodobacter olei TaxID=2493082 RepID=UPI000FD72C56